jgi:hypothetical protein
MQLDLAFVDGASEHGQVAFGTITQDTITHKQRLWHKQPEK